MAGDRQDAGLLSLGAAVERHLDARRAPRYLPTAGPREVPGGRPGDRP